MILQDRERERERKEGGCRRSDDDITVRHRLAIGCGELCIRASTDISQRARERETYRFIRSTFMGRANRDSLRGICKIIGRDKRKERTAQLQFIRVFKRGLRAF